MAETVTNILELKEDFQPGNYLTFKIENETYAIERCFVLEIIGIQRITKIREMPDYVRGIINLNGKIVPLMDVRLRLGMIAKEYTEQTRIIVLDIYGFLFGLVVDRLSYVIDLHNISVLLPLGINKQPQRRFIKAVGKVGHEIMFILDIEKFLDCNDLDH